MKVAKSDRLKQIEELRNKLSEQLVEFRNQLHEFEEDIQSSKATVLSSDDARKAAFQLAYEEDMQIVKVNSQPRDIISILYWKEQTPVRKVITMSNPYQNLLEMVCITGMLP